MARNDARVRYTKHVLKESLLTLLQDKPVNRITVKEVCQMAQLNRATFYAHYSDCFDLKDSIEQELVDAFEDALDRLDSPDVGALIQAIYNMIRTHEKACRVLVFGSSGTTVTARMTALARPAAMELWRKHFPKAAESELEMLYTHLSNGLLQVVVDGYDRYSREDVVRFVRKIVQASLTPFA